jgi:hypothetical protein
MPIVLKSGSLNLLEASGPVQAYNGIALPLPPISRVDFLGYDVTSMANLLPTFRHNVLDSTSEIEMSKNSHSPQYTKDIQDVIKKIKPKNKTCF